jgi:hypothetical protein
MTENLDYRHRIALLCSRETEKKEKFPGSEAPSLPSAVEVRGEEAGTTWYPGECGWPRPLRDEIEAIRHRLPKTGPDPAKPLS